MRIGVDARELTGFPTGVGRYLAGLLTQWERGENRGHEFVLYAHRPLSNRATTIPARIIAGSGGTAWEQTTLARVVRADHCDVLYAPGYTAPLWSGVPTALVVHDLSFVAHPEWFSSREGLRRRWLTRQAAAKARAVITISEFSRGEIHRHFGTATAKLHVVPPAIDPPIPLGRVVANHATDDVHVLYVGSIFNRRHVPTLIEAAAQTIAAHPAVVLDIVGDNRTFPYIDVAALIARQRSSAHLQWHRYVSETELHALYRRARAFVYLSEYEGFGLTPLEALSAGIPPVLLDTPVGHETCGDAALFVPRDDIAATSAAIERVLFDGPTRSRILHAAPAVLARYRWETSAAATLAIIEDMV